MVQHRRERRRLPRACGAGDEDEAALLLGEPPHSGWKMELVERGDRIGDDPERERDRAALTEPVDAEARKAWMRVRDVEVARLVERRAPEREPSP